MRLARQRWTSALVLVGASALALVAWLAPERKAQGVFGRLDYAELVLALAATVVALAAAVVACGRLASLGRRAKRCAAVVFGLALATIACELAARWLAPAQPLRNPFYAMEEAGNLASPDLPFVRPAHIDWSGASTGDLSGGLHDAFTRTVRFRTDADGFRNDEDVARAELVFVGDSNTEAGNVDVADTFAARTAASLSRTWRNLGRAGYGPPSELVVLERFGLACEPALVVWQISEQNDLDDSARHDAWERAGRPPWLIASFASRRPELDGWKRFSPTHQLFERLCTHAREPFEVVLTANDGSRFRTRFLRSGFGPALDPDRHAGWPPLERALRHGAKLLAERNVRLAIVFVPLKLRVLENVLGPRAAVRAEIAAGGGIARPSPFATRLAELARDVGALYVDPTAALEARAAAGEVVFFPLDTHPTARGHELIAGAIVEAVRAAGF